MKHLYRSLFQADFLLQIDWAFGKKISSENASNKSITFRKTFKDSSLRIISIWNI